MLQTHYLYKKIGSIEIATSVKINNYWGFFKIKFLLSVIFVFNLKTSLKLNFQNHIEYQVSFSKLKFQSYNYYFIFNLFLLWSQSNFVILIFSHQNFCHHTRKKLSPAEISQAETTQPATTCSKLTIKTPEKKCEICSKFTIKTPEWRHWRRSSVVIVNFWTFFTTCSSVSVANFEQVNVNWEVNDFSVLLQTLIEISWIFLFAGYWIW